MKTKKWLITGGAGFIGTNLISFLLNNKGPAYIRVLDNLSVGTREDLSVVCKFLEITPDEITAARHESTGYGIQHDACDLPRVELLKGDIKNPETCLAATTDMDFVIHLAANTGVGPSVQYPRADMESNVLGTFNLLEAARQNNVKSFIFASSGAPVGEVEPPIHEEIAPHPVSPYGASKLAGEAYCSAYNRTFGLQTVVLRFGNVFGPRSKRKSSVVAKFIRQALKGETLEIYGDGTQTRDFIYIDDLTQAIVMSADTNGIGGEIFQIATNKEHTVNELIDILAPLLKEAGYTDIKVEKREPRLGDVKRNYSDTTKAKTILNWQANIPLKEGVNKTLAWFLALEQVVSA